MAATIASPATTYEVHSHASSNEQGQWSNCRENGRIVSRVDSRVQWIVAAGVTIMTTRHLMVAGFHYPMMLLIAHLALALIFRTFSGLQQPPGTRDSNISSHLRLSRELVFLAAIVGALVFSYQAMFHVSNTTFVAMTLTLAWEPGLDHDGDDVWSLRSPKALPTLFHHITVLVCLIVLYLNENMLPGRTEPALYFAAVCGMLARWAWPRTSSYGASASGSVHWLDLRSCSLAMSLALAVVVWWPLERGHLGDFTLSGRWILFVINVTSGAVTLCCGTMFFSLPALAEGRTSNVLEHFAIPRILVSFLLVVAIQLDNEFAQTRPTYTSTMQWLAYLVASFASIGVLQLCAIATGEFGWDELDSSCSEDPHMRGKDVSATSGKSNLWRSLIPNGLAWILLICTITSLFLPKPPPPAINTNEEWNLDLVFARYEEPIKDIADTTSSLLSLPNIAQLRTRVIIYNKSSNNLSASDLAPLASITPNYIVTNRPNKGREGETFLSHIISSFDEESDVQLAPHTLFAQAIVEDPNWMLPRVRDYFLPSSTGFLSLSYVGNFCPSCERCGDESGFNENNPLFASIFAASNPDEGGCRDLSLTYKGQFIASKERIRTIPREVFEDLRERLNRTEEFGYALERLWGVVLRCPRIGAGCPSLFSGYLGREGPGGVEECQCLD